MIDMPSNVVKQYFLNIIFISIWGVMLFYHSHSEKQDPFFESDFTSSSARHWIGPEYWSNPLQDWQIKEGKLECVVSKKGRNVHLLTSKLDEKPGDFTSSVHFELLNTDTTHFNWIGFSVASKGEFNDYRDDAIFGKGIHAGITTQGKLFIGNENDGEVNSGQKAINWTSGKSLHLSWKEEARTIQLSLKDRYDQTIKIVQKSIPDSIHISGDMVLVSHFEKNSAEASVSFYHWTLQGAKISTHPEYAFGPILFSQYTLSRGTLKLTAQMAPVEKDVKKIFLEIKNGKHWVSIDSTSMDSLSRTATFRIENWDISKDSNYRIVCSLPGKNTSARDFFWEGMIRKVPMDKEEISIAAFTGNNDLGFPNTDLVAQIKYHDPDLLFFSGDQIYESVGGFGIVKTPIKRATLDYLRKWYIYGWAYRDLLKDRPSVSIPDDHDVYHGNIWGAGGKAIPKSYGFGAKAQDAGGYKMPPEWVNMVQRTQCSHLPDPIDPKPVEQGIEVYFTDMSYGGISLAIIEDRKFKSAPKSLLPEADIRNGWAQNQNFDMKKNGNPAEAELLGERQMTFLENWAKDWSDQVEMKVLLSQTIFANVATLPEEATSGAIIPTLRILNKGEYPPNDRAVADMDSNGWPRGKRDKAVSAIRKAFAFHLAGDQHLGSSIQYGIDDWQDSGYAFCVPSISNYWPRRWYPKEESKNRAPGAPRYTGDFEDGFGNKMSVLAVSNPLFTGKKPAKLYDRAAGYGIVRLNKKNRTIAMECWPRQADPSKGPDQQYEGWPIIVKQEDQYLKKDPLFLPEMHITGLDLPVIEVYSQEENEMIYSLRINKKHYRPKVNDKSKTYKIRVGDPDKDLWKIEENVTLESKELIFEF